jgi:hypothetical protein
MNKTAEIMFVALRVALFGEVPPKGVFADMSAEQWNDLYRLAARQGVLAIVYDVVSGLPKEERPPRNPNIRWALSTEAIEKRYEQQREVATLLADNFAKEDIKTYVLKGLGISTYYPIPEHRECGDFDCYLGDGFEKGNRVALSIGVNFKHKDYRHYVLQFNGVLIENHHYFVAFRGNRLKKKFEKQLHEIIESDVTYEDTKIYIPSPLFSALFLTSHAFQHFLYENITLRHIIDWALLIRRDKDSIDWNVFNQICIEQGFSKFVGVLNGIVKIYFGQDCLYPNAFYNFDYCDKVLDSILYIDNSISNKNMTKLQSRLAKIKNMSTYSWKYKYISNTNWVKEGLRSVLGIVFEKNPII